jgi:hypothetical protein
MEVLPLRSALNNAAARRLKLLAFRPPKPAYFLPFASGRAYLIYQIYTDPGICQLILL